jgi:hypothetical protein
MKMKNPFWKAIVMQKYVVITVFFIMPIAVLSSAALGRDGTYDATVTTESGSYSVPVEVEGDEVALVYWPNGGEMHVHGADLDSDGETSGYNSRGDWIQVEIDNYDSEEDEE